MFGVDWCTKTTDSFSQSRELHAISFKSVLQKRNCTFTWDSLSKDWRTPSLCLVHASSPFRRLTRSSCSSLMHDSSRSVWYQNWNVGTTMKSVLLSATGHAKFGFQSLRRWDVLGHVKLSWKICLALCWPLSAAMKCL